MTKPGPGRNDGAPFRPARLGRTSASTRREPAEEQADIARGSSDALLGALGRMQLRLDLLTREQQEQAAVVAALARRVAALEPPRARSAPADGG